MKECFVIMPISSGEAYRLYKNRYDHIIKPAVEGLAVKGEQVFKCIRADFISSTGSITRQVLQRLYTSDAVIADLTDLNPNVFYELGVRHALRNKTILIALEGTKAPFDVGDLRIIYYEDRVGAEKEVIPKIQEALSSFTSDVDQLDSPIFSAIPELHSKDDKKEIQARIVGLERENESLRTKLTVSEQTNISIQQTLTSLTEAVNKVTSHLGADEKRITEEEIERVVRARRQILAKPAMFDVPDYEVDDGSVFVLMPFTHEFRPVYEAVVEAATNAGLKCYRADEIFSTNLIMNDIFEHILRAGIIVADVTDKNPNVLYEVGIAMTIGKQVLFITQNVNDLPFDLRALRVIPYKLKSVAQIFELRNHLRDFFIQYIQDSKIQGTRPGDKRKASKRK